VYEQRFRILEPRALYEIGLPVALFWLSLLLQLLLGGLRGGGLNLDLGFARANLLVYNTVLALGGAAVWAVAWRWTHTEVVVAPQGLALEAMGLTQWLVPWDRLASWTWDWGLGQVPIGLLIIPKGGLPLRIQLGFLGLGRRVCGVVQPFPQYLPLLKALGYYLPGEQWREPPLKAKKGLWG
jgi:hypothetical protein